jgi:hypothetical protein
MRGNIEMMQRIADASPLFKARTAGFFWMMVFLAGSLALFVGRGVVSSVANIVAPVCYIAVTLLLYDLLKPVNRSVSLVAALFGLAGCAISLFGLTRFVLLRDLVFSGSMSSDRLPHSQIDLSTSNSGCPDGVRRIGLANLSVAAARKAVVPVQSDPRHGR